MRGCLTLLVGFVVGAGLMLVWWPQQPKGIAKPQSSDLRVFVSDAYLSRAAQRRVAGYTLPHVRQVTVSSSPPAALLVSAELSEGPLTAPANLELQPVAENGQIAVHIVSIHVAGIPIPSQLTGALADSIDSSSRHAMGAHTRVTGVIVTSGGLEIYANYR